MLRVLSLLFCATVIVLIAAVSIGGALGQDARGMGLTAFIVDPGVMDRNDLEHLFGNGGSTRDYAVVFSPGASGLANGEFDSGLLARPSGPPWHIDTNKVAEELASTQSGPIKPFTVHVAAQVLKDLATDLGRFRDADTRWRQTPDTPIPLDIVLLLQHRLQNEEGMAIGKSICDDQDRFRQLREPRQRLNGLFDAVTRQNFKLDVRILVGLGGQGVSWTNVDLHNVLSALGLSDKETRVSVAQIFPAQDQRGTAMDFEPKRLLSLDPLMSPAMSSASPPPPEPIKVEPAQVHIVATPIVPAPPDKPKKLIPVPPHQPDQSGSSTSPAGSTSAISSPNKQDGPVVAPSVPARHDVPVPSPPDLTHKPTSPDQPLRVPVNIQPAKKPSSIKPGAEWSIEYARERDAPPSHFLAFVETQGQVDNADVDFVEIPPGSQRTPQDATGEREFVRTPAGRYLYERGSHVIYMRITPAPSACSAGKSVRVSIAIEGNALDEGTPAGLTVAEKVSTCEPIIRRVATFTIP